MGGTLPPVYALLTALTALVVAAILVPVLRLMLEPGIVLPRRFSLHTPAAAGSLSVLFGAAVLLPMGGDGFVVPFSDAPIAFGLFSALTLFFLGSTAVYAKLSFLGRLGLQAAVAYLAAVGGVHAQAGTFGTHVLSMLVLLVAMNAIEAMRHTHGLSVGAAAVAAGFLACVAPAFTEHGLSDLNLGLCGALLALLAFEVVPRVRLRVELGSGGRLAVGFLIGMTYLRLAPQAVPEMRAWMLLPMLLPLATLLVTALGPALRRFPERFRRPRFELRAALGLKSMHVLVLGLLANITVAVATLRVLGML